MKANDIVIEFNSVSYFCHVRFYRLHNQSFAVKGKVNVVRISWLFAPNPTRPVSYRVRGYAGFFCHAPPLCGMSGYEFYCRC